LQEGLSNNPNDKQLLLQMGDLKEHQGDHQAALNFWRKAKAAEVYYWRGRKWMDIENEDAKAEPYFLNTIEIDPYHWGGYEFLVMLYQRHSRTPDAITLLAKAVVLFPDNPRPAQMLADLIQNR
jgi:tetratricopeptide (TPR) repeat protein